MPYCCQSMPLTFFFFLDFDFDVLKLIIHALLLRNESCQLQIHFVGSYNYVIVYRGWKIDVEPPLSLSIKYFDKESNTVRLVFIIIYYNKNKSLIDSFHKYNFFLNKWKFPCRRIN